jgi:L-fucose mutarotase
VKTITGEAVVLAGCDLPRAVDAICSVMPLDFFVDCPALYMAPDPGVELPPLGAEVHEALKGCIQKHAAGVTIEPLPRMEFYDRADQAFAIVQCVDERRPYGNVVLKKGVVGPDGNDLKP